MFLSKSEPCRLTGTVLRIRPQPNDLVGTGRCNAVVPRTAKARAAHLGGVLQGTTAGLGLSLMSTTIEAPQLGRPVK